MKKQLLCLAVATASLSLFAADAKEEVKAAAKKLGDAANYTWKTTVVVPESAQFKPGPSEGKTEKGGFTQVKSTFNDNETQVVTKGEKTAFINRDGEWQVAGEGGGGGGGGGRGRGGFFRNTQTPAVQAAEIVAAVKELKKEGDAYVGEFTEEGAKTLMRFRRGGGGGGGGEGPAISNAKGSAKFWVKDGVLTKYEFKVSGKMDFNGNEIDMDRTSTVEIKDVGTTKLEVPEAAKQKLS
ncbi:MAG TPA: hypothetical protein VFZ59_22860 [Verrucomicrobiae bacterium]|nr:hypothetical protein [Verrucomicrobiae bacterium]